MQNLKRNWLVSSKLTWGFDDFWTKHCKISKVVTLELLFIQLYNEKNWRVTFPKERHCSKQANTLILKAVLLISQNMFQNIHTSSSVAQSIIKTANILNLHIS